MRPLLIAVAPVLTAATLGNVFIRRPQIEWFRSLRRPKILVPFRVFVAVGVTYYLMMTVVLYRASSRNDAAAIVTALIVLALGETWNAVLFGLRDVRLASVGVMLFLVPAVVLELLLLDDPLSAVVFGAYLAWVVYDWIWMRQMAALNVGTKPST